MNIGATYLIKLKPDRPVKEASWNHGMKDDMFFAEYRDKGEYTEPHFLVRILTPGQHFEIKLDHKSYFMIRENEAEVLCELK